MAEVLSAANPLAALFESAGDVREIAGNRPMALDDPASVWLVASGHVEVFSVDAADAQAPGRRYHFFSADPGDVLFGIDLTRIASGQTLLAVGVVGTLLVRAPLAVFQQWAIDPAVADQVAAVVERWVTGLSFGVTRLVLPKPRVDFLVEAGDVVDAAAGQRIKAKTGVVWLKHVPGSSLFIGMEDLPDTGTDVWIPVSTASWIQMLESSNVGAFATRTILGDEALWRGLDAFCEVVFRCEFFNTRLAAADELNRLKEKARRDQRLRQSSLLDLATVMETGRRTQAAPATDDPLLAAASLVGQRIGCEIKPAPRPKDGERADDPLKEILRASRIRSRQVLLKPGWYRKDAGPLLAYEGEEKTPVALLPVSPGAYDLVEPLTGRRERITRRNAGWIQPIAFTFYRPFPGRAMTPLELLAFAAGGFRKADLVVALLLGLSSGALGLATPYFSGFLVDTVIPDASTNQLLELAIILGAVTVGSVIFDTIQSLTMLRVETMMQASVQPALWDRLLGLPASFFRRFSAGDLAQRMSAADQVRQTLSSATITALMSGLFSLFLFAQLFYYSMDLAWVSTAVILVAVLATTWAAVRKVNIQRSLFAIEGKIAGLVLQLLTGITKLRVAGAEGRAFAMWGRQFAAKRRLAFHMVRVDKWFDVFTSVIPIVGSMAIFGSLVWWVNADPTVLPMSAGTFIAFNAAAALFLGRMLGLSRALISTMVALPLYERARPVLESLPEVDDDKMDPGEISGAIEVSRVSFRYDADGPLILDDVSLKIEPGEFVAVVGPSGSGKSTLLRMLLGLDRPETGSVYYDGKDLALLDVQKLRRRIGVVMQNNRIRAGSLFENIVGSSGLTMEDAWEAARMAGLDQDIKQMPMGLHTVLQQGGGTLSGGQRQRLLIARALATRPRLLLFDEATSALDNRTQAIVSESLASLQASRVVIAHRLSTIVGADRIYVMAAGKVLQVGSYAELAVQEGLFAELIRRQVA
ncbi:MAG TPA: NHLP bacteriocin export ABC transporter permease/ATPase subunit [Vicinamibacterales bacterium]